MRSTLVLGASLSPERYANQAVRLLTHYKHPVTAVGASCGMIGDVAVLTSIPPDVAPHTITLYINPAIQSHYREPILRCNPKRIIFNPGTENAELAREASAAGIEVVEACTLVMLRTGQY